MEYFDINIEKATLENKHYRNVIYTSPNKKTQLVLMSLRPHESIGMEVHKNADQFIRIEKGRCRAEIGIERKVIQMQDGSAIVIPAGTYHDIINYNEETKLYTIYSPAQHVDGLMQLDRPSDKLVEDTTKYPLPIKNTNELTSDKVYDIFHNGGKLYKLKSD